jgi:hypothetical protein
MTRENNLAREKLFHVLEKLPCSGILSRYLSERVALTPPGFLNRREWRLQSQPHDLQYHSVMPSHSSR